VLVSLDEQSDYWPAPLYGNVPNPRTITGQLNVWGGYTRHEPVSWVKNYGDGRVFYTNLGHNPETWDRVDFQSHLFEGIKWASTVRPDRACLAASS
jgi:type 1 glutamine amidotransferase